MTSINLTLIERYATFSPADSFSVVHEITRTADVMECLTIDTEGRIDSLELIRLNAVDHCVTDSPYLDFYRYAASQYDIGQIDPQGLLALAESFRNVKLTMPDFVDNIRRRQLIASYIDSRFGTDGIVTGRVNRIDADTVSISEVDCSCFRMMPDPVEIPLDYLAAVAVTSLDVLTNRYLRSLRD